MSKSAIAVQAVKDPVCGMSVNPVNPVNPEAAA